MRCFTAAWRSTALPRGVLADWPFTQGAVCERQRYCCQRSKGRFYTGQCFASWWICSKIRAAAAAALLIGSWTQFAVRRQTAARQCKDTCWNQLDPINGAARQRSAVPRYSKTAPCVKAALQLTCNLNILRVNCPESEECLHKGSYCGVIWRCYWYFKWVTLR